MPNVAETEFLKTSTSSYLWNSKLLFHNHPHKANQMFHSKPSCLSLLFPGNSFCWGGLFIPCSAAGPVLVTSCPSAEPGCKEGQRTDWIKNTDPCPVFYLLFYLIIKGRFYSHWGWCWRALREDSPSFQQIFFLPFSSVLICLTVNKMLPHCN